jgi:hypothetical protein
MQRKLVRVGLTLRERRVIINDVFADFKVATLAAQIQRRVALLILGLDISPMVQQNRHYARMSVHCGQVQRRVRVVVVVVEELVHFFVFQKVLDQIAVALDAGDVKTRLAVFVLHEYELLDGDVAVVGFVQDGFDHF